MEKGTKCKNRNIENRFREADAYPEPRQVSKMELFNENSERLKSFLKVTYAKKNYFLPYYSPLHIMNIFLFE